MSASRLNTEQLGRAFASSADAPASRSAVRRRRIVILVWRTTVALAIGAVIGLSVWPGVQEKKKSRNLDIPLQSVQFDGFISNPSGDLQMIKMNNVLMAGAVASAASLGMCADAFAQSSAVQWTTASGGNGHWYARRVYVGPIDFFALNQWLHDSQGSHLGTVRSAGEDDFVWNNFGASTSLVLGGYQDHSSPDYSEPSGGWRWITGEPFDSVRWFAGEPNEAFGQYSEDFLQYHSWGHGWNDAENTSQAAAGAQQIYLIEWDADCNSDGIVDYGQILSGQLIDANSNGIPIVAKSDHAPATSLATTQSMVSTSPHSSALGARMDKANLTATSTTTELSVELTSQSSSAAGVPAHHRFLRGQRSSNKM